MRLRFWIKGFCHCSGLVRDGAPGGRASAGFLPTTERAIPFADAAKESARSEKRHDEAEEGLHGR